MEDVIKVDKVNDTMNVIKRDGHIEPFDKHKLIGSIKKAMIDARLSINELDDEIEKIYDKVKNKIGNVEEVDVSKIRSTVLSELDNNKEAASAQWRKFDGKYKAN